MSRMAAWLAAGAAVLVATVASADGVPQVRGGGLRVTQVQDLGTALASLGGKRSVWVGWEVGAIPGRFQMCCHIPRRGETRLRGSGHLTLGHGGVPDDQCVLDGADHWLQIGDHEEHEPPQRVLVLARFERGAAVRNHSNPAVRQEALFWLAESGDRRALDFIETILIGKT